MDAELDTWVEMSVGDEDTSDVHGGALHGFGGEDVLVGSVGIGWRDHRKVRRFGKAKAEEEPKTGKHGRPF